jgi:hypothetical protein
MKLADRAAKESNLIGLPQNIPYLAAITIPST